MTKNGQNGQKMAENDQKWSKMTENGRNDQK